MMPSFNRIIPTKTGSGIQLLPFDWLCVQVAVASIDVIVVKIDLYMVFAQYKGIRDPELKRRKEAFMPPNTGIVDIGNRDIIRAVKAKIRFIAYIMPFKNETGFIGLLAVSDW
jgi:hypothetical protein